MPKSNMQELNRLTKQLYGIADTNNFSRPHDYIPVNHMGKKYYWERLNPNSHRVKKKIEAIKAQRR